MSAADVDDDGGGEVGGMGGMDESIDAEDRVVLESVDDWRMGRHLISRMGYCAEDGKGLGLSLPPICLYPPLS